MANTTNFGWETPDDTDLVKDGAAAIRTLGSAIDTSLVDLKGGTTGQVLAKASNTDMDFTWAADASGIPATIFDAKGDIIAASAADTAARLAVGANGTVLTADSGETTGLKWAAPAVSKNFTLVNSGGTALSGSATVTVSGITDADMLLIRINDAASAGTSTSMSLRINTDSGSNYQNNGLVFQASSPYAGNNLRYDSNLRTDIPLAFKSSDSASVMSGYCLIFGGNSDGLKVFQATGSANAPSSSFGNLAKVVGGFWNNSATITSVSVIHSSGNFTGGTIYVYKSI